jgi:hypothetical protein
MIEPQKPLQPSKLANLTCYYQWIIPTNFWKLDYLQFDQKWGHSLMAFILEIGTPHGWRPTHHNPRKRLHRREDYEAVIKFDFRMI